MNLENYVMNNVLNQNYYFLIFFPLTFIFGIFIAEIFFLLFLLNYLYNLNFKYLFKDTKIIIIFFFAFYILISSIIFIHDDLIYSSLIYFRFVFFSLSVCFFFERINKINLSKNYLYIFLALIICLILDSYFQFFNGTNIFGQTIINHRISSFFGDELILGSYLVRVLPLIIWYIIFFNFDLNLHKNKFLIFLIIYFYCIFLSAERTSLALLTLFVFLSIIFMKSIRVIVIKSFIVFILLMILTSIFQIGKSDVGNRVFLKTYNQLFSFTEKKIHLSKIIKKNIENKENIDVKYFSTEHEGHFELALDLFKNNKIFGVGPRGFRYFCRSVNYNPKIGVCSTHPHNYFIQILSELGIIGILFYFIFLIFISLKLLSKKINNHSLVVKNQFYIISIGLILNLFPFIPSGNFFNNWLSLMIYFNLGLYLYTYKKIFDNDNNFTTSNNN